MKRLLALLCALLLVCANAFAFTSVKPGRSGGGTDLSSAGYGDTVIFGRYNQNGGSADPLEWIVLERNGTELIMMTKNAIAAMPFSDDPDINQWAYCSLRKWLNRQFMNSAFDSDERAAMLQVQLPSERNPFYDTLSPGPGTTDYVFLLSWQEWRDYVSGSNFSICGLTPTAMRTITRTESEQYVIGHTNCWWWLRSVSFSDKDAQFVNKDGGSTRANHLATALPHGGVRPVICVDVSRYYK